MISAARGLRDIRVLLIEDNPGDVRLTEEAFRAAEAHVSLHAVVDGVEAMEYLKQSGAFALAPRPDVILLDLNLPRMSGSEVLAKVKQDESLKAIPVVVLTTSVAETDILRCYQLHANCYVSKPVQLEAFEHVVKSISDFWVKTAKLPRTAHVR